MLSFITPNTYLRQPRYKDLRGVLLQKTILKILNLGENVFEDAVVPVAITLLINSNNNRTIDYVDLTSLLTKNNAYVLLLDIVFDEIKQTYWLNTPNCIFVNTIIQKTKKSVALEELLTFKDAGINYQRINVGLSQKGTSDLSKRLFYEGSREKNSDYEYWKGTDINQYYISPTTNRFCRTNIMLSENERVILNKEYFAIHPKLIWRQTAPYPICSIDYDGIWFGRSIQAGLINKKYQKDVSYEFLCGLLNSKYLRYLYEQNVKEGGRVFPQVKLEHLKPLPIIIDKVKQSEIESLVSQIISEKKRNLSSDTKDLERKIDRLVYNMYELTDDEIKTIENG